MVSERLIKPRIKPSSQVSRDYPVKLYAEVKLSGVPVINARVLAHITATDHRGIKAAQFSVDLFDSGNGGKIRKELKF